MNDSRLTLSLLGCVLASACGEPREPGEAPDLAPALYSTSSDADDDDDDESDDGPPNWATAGSGPELDDDGSGDGAFASSSSDGSSTGGEESSSSTDDGAEIPGAECDRLGYEGTCFHGISVWSQDGKCRVRDCVSEGLGCGWISDDEGWGCVPVLGDGPSTAFWCETLGEPGTCLANDVRVWVQDGTCNWQHCGDTGQTCSLSAQSVNECV